MLYYVLSFWYIFKVANIVLTNTWLYKDEIYNLYLSCNILSLSEYYQYLSEFNPCLSDQY